MNDYTIIIPSNRPNLAIGVQESLKPLNSVIFDGAGYTSYAKIMNDLILSCPTELVIVCNDKGRPNPEHVDQVLSGLSEGYGMYWLHPCGFGGFYKDVIREIGFYDERYVDGNYEDCDIQRKLKEADIAMYCGFEIPWIKMRSSWTAIKSREFFYKKWKDGEDTLERLLPDEDYGYDLGPHTGRKFLPSSRSVSPPANGNFDSLKYIENCLSPTRLKRI